MVFSRDLARTALKWAAVAIPVFIYGCGQKYYDPNPTGLQGAFRFQSPADPNSAQGVGPYTTHPFNPAAAVPSRLPHSTSEIPTIALAANEDSSAAFAAYFGGNHAEALRFFRKFDAEGDAAVASMPEGGPYIDPTGRYNQGNTVIKKGLSDDLAAARNRVGEYYEKGVVVPRDYQQAAAWYLKSLNTAGGHDLRVVNNLALLLASGTGIKQDKKKARELLESNPASIDLLRLLDHDLLPRTMTDVEQGAGNVAMAKLNAEEERAQKEEADKVAKAQAEQSRRAAASTYSGTSSSQCAYTCENRKSDCQSKNTDTQFDTFVLNPTLGGLMEADTASSNCSQIYDSCMRSCSP